MRDKTHTPDCAWTKAECEYKETHFYCPHPEHACTCHVFNAPPKPKPKLEPHTALEQIKLTALTCKNAQLGLYHIVSLCIDAGITDKLPALEKLHPTGHER